MHKNLETSSKKDHGSSKIGDKTFGFLIIFGGATSHVTAYPCKSSVTSEVIAKLHKWMDTFQMNLKAICVDMAFNHPHDMQAFNRMHNVKRIPTGPHYTMAKPSRDKFSTVQVISLGIGGYSLQKREPDHSGTNHSCPVDAQGSNGETYTGDLKW